MQMGMQDDATRWKAGVRCTLPSLQWVFEGQIEFILTAKIELLLPEFYANRWFLNASQREFLRSRGTANLLHSLRNRLLRTRSSWLPLFGFAFG